MENDLLESCVAFSKRRIQTYWSFLQVALKNCRKAVKDEAEGRNLRQLVQSLIAASSEPVELCRYCHMLMRSKDMDFIKDRAMADKRHGTRQSHFINAKHNMGRLACHIKDVKVLLFAAQRLPHLFLDPEVVLIESPCSMKLPPSLRPKCHLDGIASRMIPASDGQFLSEIQDRLKHLNDRFGIEKTVREEYANKNFKPRVHAELLVLEYFHQREDTLQYLDNDRFIGCSKPACYCCSLYFRAANMESPDTHQKIYLNWLPRTSVSRVEEPNSNLVKHEMDMLNKMVSAIRTRVVEQIRSQTGRRQRHFDSNTGETMSRDARDTVTMPRPVERLLVAGVYEPEHLRRDATLKAATLLQKLDVSPNVTASDSEDSDNGGGARLL